MKKYSLFMGVFIPLIILVWSLILTDQAVASDLPPLPESTGENEAFPSPGLEITLSETITITQLISDSLVIDGFEIQATNIYTIHLPMVIQPPPPPTLVLYCDNFQNPITIPDNNETGTSVQMNLSDAGKIYDMNVRLEISHTWVGDLKIELANQLTGKSTLLLDRPGFPSSESGCSGDGIGAIFDDEITIPAENLCSSGTTAIAGIYVPVEPLSFMDNELIAGNWLLNVSDNSVGDSGKIKSWCIEALIGKSPYSPPEPPPEEIPAQAQINNITGKKQALPLDCETRVSVDWAKYFGKTIDEITFQNRLPKSDNPDQGFVGNVNGTWGQIPPNAYGIHAGPVVDLLRSYGVSAYGHRPLTWNRLKAEIAASRPVIVWVAGSANRNEVPIYYTSTDGHRTIVAHYEHTVLVVGYTQTTVTILDGGTRINRTLDQFLSSWSALNNMAITAIP